jgi:hypothetical protein
MYKQFSPSLERSSGESDVPTRPGRVAVRRSPERTAEGQAALDPGTLSHMAPAVAGASLLRLQRLSGNLAVQRWIQRSREGAEGESEVSPAVERSIDSSRGNGHPLDQAARSSIGGALNADFSGVRVHTDAQAGALNESLGARAFTTGQDIYFRQGEYNPGSSTGKSLLAHELTHVVQQNPGLARAAAEEDKGGLCPACKATLGGGVQAKLTVGSPGDIYEQEADSVAREFGRREQSSAGTLSRQTLAEENQDEKLQAMPGDGRLSRQPEEDQEKKRLARAVKEDEEVRRKPEDEEQKKLG